MEPSHIVLVACAASKRREQSAARDLYVSTLFKEARRYAESVSDRWYILSALHMVLDPGRIIDPYEQTLNEMPIALRRQWARQGERSTARDSPGWSEAHHSCGEDVS